MWIKSDGPHGTGVNFIWAVDMWAQGRDRTSGMVWFLTLCLQAQTLIKKKKSTFFEKTIILAAV